MPATCFCFLKSCCGKELERGCNALIVVRLVCWAIGLVLAYMYGDTKKVYDQDVSLATRFNYVEVFSGRSSSTGADGNTTETRWVVLTEKSGASGTFKCSVTRFLYNKCISSGSLGVSFLGIASYDSA